MKANNFNELSFIQSFQNQDYHLYQLNDDKLLINNKGHIIKLCEHKDNEIRISSMNVSLGSFFESSIKLDIIVRFYDLLKKNELYYITNDKGLTLLQEDIISYCKANILHTETFSTDFFFAYYLLYNN